MRFSPFKLRLQSLLTAITAAWTLMVTGEIAHAWSAGGHKVVALIAYKQLDERARAAIVKILEQHPVWEGDFTKEMPPEVASGPESERQRWIFAQAAIWPDIARKHKAPPMDYHRSTWHYINDPLFLSPELALEFAGHLPVNLSYGWDSAVDAELQNAPQTITMAQAILKDKASTPEKKALAICWLFHVVGDLHQPLHCTTLISRQVFRKGDKGGNGIELRKPGSRNGKTLHAFWDALLKGNVSLSEASGTMVSILGDVGQTEKAATAGANLKVQDWVAEGKEAARKHAYTQAILDAVRAADTAADGEGKVFVTMTDQEMADYGRAAGGVAAERAVLAGFRLGAMLNSVFRP